MADKMIRCPEGHFYDPAKHTACPWCALPSDAGGAEQKTRPVKPGALETPGPPPLPGSNPPPVPPGPGPGATVRYGGAGPVPKTGPVVGWLVCLDGPDRGQDYRLHSEKNYIGRAPEMDVVILNDNTVSRDKHGVVVFDPKKQSFWVLAGEAKGLVYLNGELVQTPMRMNRDDVLELGQTKLVLVPFCGEKYSWSAEAPPATV
jgi:hypothetical protein